MSRKARLVIPNTAHHIVHRAYNREPIFISDRDYKYYLTNLLELRLSLGCKVYAFCIMLNHVHLLVDPSDCPANLARLMKHLAGRQAGYAKTTERKTGPLWEGRYHSSPVAEDFLLACARFIEFNPVRHCLVKQPGQYQWSSARSRLKIGPAVADFDEAYIRLGATAEERSENYRGYLGSAVPWREWDILRRAVFSSNVTGDENFGNTVASLLGFSVLRKPKGRPPNRDRVAGLATH
jgi:REP-associated tyrosine transposase